MDSQHQMVKAGLAAPVTLRPLEDNVQVQRRNFQIQSEAIDNLRLRTSLLISVPFHCLELKKTMDFQQAWALPQLAQAQPTHFLLRRMDLFSAEVQWRLAQLQLTDIERGYLPSLNISLTLGDSQSLLSQLLKAPTLTVAQGLSAFIAPLDYRWQVKSSELALKGQVLAYQKAVRTAIEEVLRLLQEYRRLETDETMAAHAYKTALSSKEQAKERLNAGLIDLLVYRQAQKATMQQWLVYLQSQHNRQMNLLALVLALGGSPELEK